MSERWTRTHDAYGAVSAMSDVGNGTAWAIVWCGGGVSRSTDKTLDESGLLYVRNHLVEPAERERLLKKAERRAGPRPWSWRNAGIRDDGEPLILFYESGPYLLHDREDPVRL